MSKQEITLSLQWIPSQLGGHSGPPYDGMRVECRWLMHWDDSTSTDCECKVQSFESANNLLSVRAKLVSHIAEERIQPGVRVLLMNGASILAVGIVSE